MPFASGKRARLWLAVLILAASSWIGLQDGLALTISEYGPLDIKFEGRNVPQESDTKYLRAELKTSGEETKAGMQDYEITIKSWSTSLGRQCKSGQIRLRYQTFGPMYKSRKTGAIEYPEAQLMIGMAGAMANLKGTEEIVPFTERDYSSSSRELRLQGTLSIPVCGSSMDFNLVPICQVGWDNAAVVECDGY